jgi:predicted RNA-binding Zn-ribbon protein involved in translation (DUF1610 family)
MRGEEDRTHAFVCPTCGETLEVNVPMRTVLVEKGCVVCGASVTVAAFSSGSP